MLYQWVPFWPQTASNTGDAVNRVFLAELALAALIMLSVVGLMLVFVVRYRKGSNISRAHMARRSWKLEIGWTTATLVAFLGLFVWGAAVYIWLYEPPKADIDIYVVAKQWMWKVQHPGGQAEIDALHIPVNKTIRLTLASQDVIHSFFVPAFRLKHDVVPGTNETIWFKPNKIGSFMLECAQFCGLQHATMKGFVDVMSGADYARWLRDQGQHETLASQGADLFRAHGCSGCHDSGATVHAPSLAGLFGSIVHMQDGSQRVADEAYIRDCILNPQFHGRRIPADHARLLRTDQRGGSVQAHRLH
jgi:cytochrome c oxidase subunit 2